MKLAGKIYAEGARFSVNLFRVHFMDNATEEKDRLIISVPKRNFKRAVKRNLLRRRTREAFRLSIYKYPAAQGKHIMFVYTAKEAVLYDEISKSVNNALGKISQ